jgi:parvulin-like peptidyl-prolyl isomerase
MHTRRRRHLVALAAGISVFAIGVAGCSSTDKAALTVNGHEFSQSSVDRELETIAASPQLKDIVTTKGGSITDAITARWLTGLVEERVADGEIARKHLKVTAGDQKIAEQRALQLFGDAAVFDAFPKWFKGELRDRYASVTAVVRINGKPPTDEEVRAQYDKSVAATCASGRFVSHILVATEAQAQQVIAQLAAGTDFGALASQVSTDVTSGRQGGDLACLDGQDIDPTFVAAANALPLGGTSAPVQTQFGWHIIRVRDIHEAVPFDAIKDGIRDDLAASSPTGQRFLRTLISRAKVKVDPGYGRWDRGSSQVKPIRKHAEKSSASSTTSSTTTSAPEQP